MLTDPNDLVVDIFGGSNTTGYAAETLNRRWLTFEASHEYLITSVFRFVEGHSSKAIQGVLDSLQDKEADVFIPVAEAALF